MDDASADLILTLQIQDLADLATDHDGEGLEGDTLSDSRMARDLYREELRNNAAIISDLRFSEKLGGAAGDEPPSPVASPTPTFNRILVKSFGQFTIEAGSSTEDESSSSHHWDICYYECVICTDEFPARHLIIAPCGDRYCKTCTGQLYDLAMADESLFPPRCCRQPIPLEIATPLLTAAQVQEFLEKRVEYNTPNRTYCHDTTCGAFVAPDSVSGEKAMCACGALTCTVCKAAAHEDDCPEDPAYALLMTFAAAEGYQTCACAAHTFAMSGVIVDRAPAPRVGAPVIPRDELIQQAAEELQENHDCTHEGTEVQLRVMWGRSQVSIERLEISTLLKLPTSRQVDAFCAKLHTFDTRNALEAAATTLRPLSSLESNASSSASITEERDLMAEVLPLRIKLLGLSTIEGIVEGGDPASTGILVAKPIDTTNRLPHFLRSLRDFVAGTGFMVSPGDEDSTHQYLGDNITIVNSTMVRWYSKASRKEPKGRAKIPRFDATDLTNKYQAYVWGADIPLDRICLEELGSMAKRSDGAPVQKERPVVATFELP
ncbi:MAG: hypothetical protein ASARMPRED_009035 [Alectoria sarmentosa]|nr:MAG: hypothetical protein ASARMPRED_009035 [Alectoria sarmentosa]